MSSFDKGLHIKIFNYLYIDFLGERWIRVRWYYCV